MRATKRSIVTPTRVRGPCSILLLLVFLSSLLLLVQSQNNDGTFCGCSECTSSVWNRMAGDHSCGERITFVSDILRRPKSDACQLVAAVEFRDICGPCFCPPQPQEQEQVQVEQLQEPDQAVAPSIQQQQIHCGCGECTDTVWNTMANGFSCGDRISYLLQSGSDRYANEADACQRVGGEEFPEPCGACACDNSIAAFANNNNNNQYDNFMIGGGAAVDDNENHTPLTPRSDLYCFPPFAQRRRFRNVWAGNYMVEIKEGAACGPSDNRFTANTVSLDKQSHTKKDRLKLQYKKVGSVWEASEVRVLRPDQEGLVFDYGVYEFHVDSIQVIDSRTGQLVDTTLPQTLTLGLFTWDATEDYARKENYNHEVDVEISRWNNPANADVQFLVQPPDLKHTHRFYSGSENHDMSQQQKYQQAPHSYGFDWRPAEIEWFSTAGGGQRFVYNSQKALEQQRRNDYMQCMPADVEVRLNLWNLFGSAQAPPGMEDYHIVEVVIDHFQFTANGLQYVPDGGTCSKACHCSPASQCWNNVCRPRKWGGTTVVSYLNATATTNSSTTTTSVTASKATANTSATTTGAIPRTTPEQLIDVDAGEFEGELSQRDGQQQGSLLPLAICMVCLGILIGLAVAVAPKYWRKWRRANDSDSSYSSTDLEKGGGDCEQQPMQEADERTEVETILTSQSFSTSLSNILVATTSIREEEGDGEEGRSGSLRSIPFVAATESSLTEGDDEEDVSSESLRIVQVAAAATEESMHKGDK